MSRTQSREPTIAFTTDGLARGSLLHPAASVLFLALLGEEISCNDLSRAERKNHGPIPTYVAGVRWYRLDNLVDWLEQRHGMTIWRAASLGQLTLPAGMAALFPREEADREAA